MVEDNPACWLHTMIKLGPAVHTAPQRPLAVGSVSLVHEMFGLPG